MTKTCDVLLSASNSADSEYAKERDKLKAAKSALEALERVEPSAVQIAGTKRKR